jgi:hypothetical protein
MAAEALVSLPALPPAVAEWEDLLVRLEIMPRALRGTLEGRDGRDPAVRATLRELLDRELRVGQWLERAAFGDAVDAPLQPAADADARWLEDRFVAVRARNFAMVQRRGVDVWEWAGEMDGARITVYQLLSWLMRSDAAVLAALRSPVAGVGAC